MGSSSSKRDRAYSSDSESPSPCNVDKVFDFSGKSKRPFIYQPSLEECEDVPDAFNEKPEGSRSRSATLSSNSSHFPTVFKWEGGGKEVYISGTFSDWKPIPMVKSHDDFALILDVPEGSHEYKFQVDGHWLHAKNQPTVDNDVGSKNNQICVKKSDFEVFEALAIDGTSSSNKVASTLTNVAFSQEVPVRNPGDKLASPPVLPPQLLEIILNKDVPQNNEPTLLPEPNHVMLNHLYALSIKDGVLVLSSTFRHKRKYVTTLLYKSI